MRSDHPNFRSDVSLRLLISAAIWGVATILYGVFLVYRWVYVGQPPGLASVTGISGVTAVGLYLLLWHRTEIGNARPECLARISVALLAVLAGAIVANTVLVFRRLGTAGSLPLVPALTTFAFSAVFRSLLLDLLAERGVDGNAANESDRENPKCDGTVVCWRCGCEHPGGETPCPLCGDPAGETETPEGTDWLEARRHWIGAAPGAANRWRIVVAVAAVLVFAISLWMLLF